jgi:hypothetical protein
MDGVFSSGLAACAVPDGVLVDVARLDVASVRWSSSRTAALAGDVHRPDHLDNVIGPVPKRKRVRMDEKTARAQREAKAGSG